MLNVIKFIHEHKDWENKLTSAPFCLKIKRDNGFIMFNYSQIESNFHKEIVRECRGLILDEEFNPVCVPFYKFGNYGESYVPDIDWTSARVQEKVDGSIIKMWYYGNGWNVSTNGTIDAYKAEIQSDICQAHTFGTLFDIAMDAAHLSEVILDEHKDCTFMFELTSPYNRVVVPYSEISITHIGTRNNITLEEVDIDIGVKKPKIYSLYSLEDCINTASKLGYDNEGYVVVDKYWNRVKIKSPAYVALHHLKGNGTVNKEKIVALIRSNENGEFLNYFPEFVEIFAEIEKKIEDFIKKCEKTINFAQKCKFNSRKSFAEFAKSYKQSALLFNWYDGKVTDVKEWFWNNSDKKIVEIIEQK